MPRKVIITCAVTGAIHTPSMSKYLPVSASEIAEAAIGAAEAGAAVVHMHARDPHDGRPSQNPDHFVPILDSLKNHTNAVINLTTGGSPHMTVEERMRPAAEFKPELASLNMGSMNFGLYPMLKRFKEFEHDWEREGLEKSRDLVFKNTFSDIETTLAMGSGERNPLRVRVLRHLAPEQPGPLQGPRADRRPAVRAVGLRAARRHQRPPRGPDAHAPHRRPAVRRRSTSGRSSAPAATR